MLIDCPVEIGPGTGDLHVGLIDEPAVPGSVAARPGRLDELRGEPLHPPVDGDVIHCDAALGQQLLDIPVRQVLAAYLSAYRTMIDGSALCAALAVTDRD